MTDILASWPRPRLLHLNFSAGPVGDSVSRELTTLFAGTWRGLHGGAGYRYRDLAAEPVPLVGPAYVALGTRMERRGVVPPAEVTTLTENTAEEREWALTLPLISELRAADTVLIGVPMYNFTVPASMKAWIDRVSFPGAYLDPDTGESLLRDTRVVVVTARGGCYDPGAPREGLDFQIPYLRAYFGNLGVSEVDFVRADLTRAADIPALAGLQDLAARSLAAARKEVTTLATRDQAA
jgi:FMN-dependent NADH-azoreductase